jgi:hypothetical protein
MEAFLAAAAARTEVSAAHFIEREFRAFLRCGVLAHSFLRVRCDDCAFERLVPRPRINLLLYQGVGWHLRRGGGM